MAKIKKGSEMNNLKRMKKLVDSTSPTLEKALFLARVGMLSKPKGGEKGGEMHQYIVIKRAVTREAYEVTAPSEGDAIELVKQGRGQRAEEYDSSQENGYEIA